jgi:transcriptional regulator with XRE-family HTH domain
VIAGLAGISKSHLQRIERGERAPDSLTEILALVELTRRAAQDRETPMAARARWMASAAPSRGTAVISCR